MLQKCSETSRVGAEAVLSCEGLTTLVSLLREQGYDVVAPAAVNGVVTFCRLNEDQLLPFGWTAEQSPGSYRLHKREDDSVFAYASGPDSLRQFLISGRLKLFEARGIKGHVTFVETVTAAEHPLAFVGVRSCDIAALRKLSDVLTRPGFEDREFLARMRGLFIVAVDCTTPSDTCFCSSVGGSPHPTDGFDLLLTEIIGGPHRFVVTVGSLKGAELLKKLPGSAASPEDLLIRNQIRERTAAALSRVVSTDGSHDALLGATEHPEWQSVARRCLACGNCTQVCPTCFCFTIEDRSSVSGDSAERWKLSDSCFTSHFSYIHGGSVRASVSARYRQWLMHKFVYWFDQFGTAGCTGCGRCITWCPAGIDLRKELQLIRATPAATEVADGNADTGTGT